MTPAPICNRCHTFTARYRLHCDPDYGHQPTYSDSPLYCLTCANALAEEKREAWRQRGREKKARARARLTAERT